MHYVYVLRSRKDGKLYVGRTDHLHDRVKAHTDGEVVSTKNRRPLELVYYEAYRDRTDSVNREKGLKKSGSVYIGLKKRIKRSIES